MSEAIPPVPQYAFMAWCLVKRRDNFTFAFYRIGRLLTSNRNQIWNSPNEKKSMTPLFWRL